MNFQQCRAWLVVVLAAVSGCRDEPRANPATQRAVKRPTVACLVPGATDLIVGMGAGDHLVAVSSYDVEREGTRGLPRVGAYRDFDWEQISVLKPEIMIVFMSPDRMPEALKQRAEELNIRLSNVKTERIDDVYAELERLGRLLGEEAKASASADRLRARLEAVRRRVEGRSRPRTLIVRELTADGVVGRESFIDDMLQAAGGENALSLGGWPSIDRETLVVSRPEVIFHLLPGASEHVVRDAQRLWTTMPQVPAVANGRVFIITDWFALQPGLHLADLAEIFAERLHPPASTTRTAS